MHPIFEKFTRSIQFTSDIKNDIYTFLCSNNCPMTAEHSIEVGMQAKKIALLFNADPEAAEIAGWLHDISAIFPDNNRIAVAEEIKIDILQEEEIFQM